MYIILYDGYTRNKTDSSSNKWSFTSIDGNLNMENQLLNLIGFGRLLLFWTRRDFVDPIPLFESSEGVSSRRKKDRKSHRHAKST